MLKSLFAVALLSSSGIALAQEAAPAQVPSPAQAAAMQSIQSAATSFGQCVSTGMQGVTADVTPEAGATSVLGACATQKDALVVAAEAFISTLPDADRPAAQAQMRSQLDEAEAQIAGAIRQQREAAAATPAQ
jgi:hypothetical protein